MRAIIIDTAIDQSYEAANDEHFDLSQHAQMRMSQRSIDLEQVKLVLSHGRMIHSRRARFYVVGRKEIKRLEKAGLDVRNLENIQIVVDERSNRILTVYRNKDFRQIRPKHRRERRMQ
ncbi:DUF4258 domain-containing protein [Pseudomonadales bacterium]|nr:DUF4258 domain-containing protein [Pseudomonadales bacterium]